MLCRDSSSSNSLSSLDSCPELAAALQSPRLGSSLDLGLLTQDPDAAQGPAGRDTHKQQHVPEQSGKMGESLSGGSSQLSMHSGVEQHLQLAAEPNKEQQQQQHPPQQHLQQQHQHQQQQHQQHMDNSGNRAEPSGPDAPKAAFGAVQTETGPSSFMQRLQDFKRGTDALRRQVRVN